MSDFDESQIKFSLDSNKSLLRKIIESLIALTFPIVLQASFLLPILLIAKVNIFLIFICVQISMFLLLSPLAFLGQLNWGVVIIPFPLTLVSLLHSSIIRNKQNNLENQDKYFALSKYCKLSIVRIFANKLEPPKLCSAYLLFIAMIGYDILGLFLNEIKINIYFLLGVLIYASLLYLNTFLVNFRIKKGFYGGNEFEAREIINFIEENSETIDFTDGNSPKKLFNEEDLKQIEEEIRIELNNGLPQPNI
ncbi:MAG: hypothetical protein AB4057_20775 [Crocosphaera sp.]